MTTTETERKPRSAEAIGAPALAAVLTRLHAAVTHTLVVHERSPADVERTMAHLDAVNHEVADLFYPPPEPEKPEDAEPMYARAVRERDQVWVKGSGWLNVLEREPGRLGVRWHLVAPVTQSGGVGVGSISFWREFEADDLFIVRRRKPAVEQA